MTRIHPAPTDPIATMNTAFGTTEPHSTHHGRTLNIHENILNFGADPTGVLDSTDAINAAIDQLNTNGLRRDPSFGATLYAGAGQGEVYMPEGWYRIEGTINITAGITLRGSGAGTVLMPYNGSATTIKMPNTNDAAPSFTVVRDFLIGAPNDNNYSSTVPVPTGTGHGIFLDGLSAQTATQIVNVQFNQLQGTTTWAIKIVNTLEVLIERCTTRGCLGGGFYFTGNSNAGVVRDCTLSNNGLGAIGGILVECEGVILDGNVVEAWHGDYGIKVSGNRAHVINNWLEDNFGHSVWIDDCPTFRVEGCYMAPNPAAGATLGSPPLNDSLKINTTTSASRGTVQNCDFRAQIFLDDTASYYLATTFISNSYGQTGVTHSGDISATLVHANSLLVRVGDRNDGAYGPNVEIVKGFITLGDAMSTPPLKWLTGSGSPETVVTAPIGSMYLRTNGSTSTTLYIKQSGSAATGWVAAFAAAPSSAYTPTNVTPDRAYDANATTTDELADVLGTLIADLKTAGILA